MLTILIADDSKASRMMLHNLLIDLLEQEVNFHFAENGEQAVVTYKQEQPDLVFLDLTMPVKNGMQALEEILQHHSQAKVVIVTADTQKITHDRALQKGALDFVNKPISCHLLQRKLGVWL